MLPETRATRYSHDTSPRSILVSAAQGLRPALAGVVDARLLLDAAGHLVGIDVTPERPTRLVVMLGPHENVSSVVDARVSVSNGGESIRLDAHAAQRITAGPNPYVR